MRVAIVGLGPKGLFVLERLLHHGDGEHSELRVDAYDPHTHPGAGPVYSPDQPSYLRMNFRAAQVNLWGRSFCQWSGAVPDSYPPRAQIGEYLVSRLDHLLRDADVPVQVIKEHVDSVDRADGEWIVSTSETRSRYDHVVLCTGHQGLSVFPVEKHLSADRVPAGARVATRGFALTFIDTALALTEGRGGAFEATGTSSLRYDGTENDVGVLIPFSRTGRPMLAKPARAEQARVSIPQLGGTSLTEDLLPTIGAIGASSGVPRAPIDAALEDALDGVPPQTDLSAEEEMRQSVEIAFGLGPPSISSALGTAWRAVYPQVVARFSHGGLDAAQWPQFRRLAAVMERLAFGPSPQNVMKLLALVDSGRVDLSFVARDRGAISDVDLVLDAVIDPPGSRDTVSQPIARLLRDGHLRIPAHQRGIEVLPDGSCVGEDGGVTPGLWAIGRPTEDSVIGNDTLNRELHPTADLLARALLSNVGAHA